MTELQKLKERFLAEIVTAQENLVAIEKVERLLLLAEATTVVQVPPGRYNLKWPTGKTTQPKRKGVAKGIEQRMLEVFSILETRERRSGSFLSSFNRDDLAKQAGVDVDSALVGLESLRRKGWATLGPDGMWTLTAKGRE